MNELRSRKRPIRDFGASLILRWTSRRHWMQGCRQMKSSRQGCLNLWTKTRQKSLLQMNKPNKKRYHQLMTTKEPSYHNHNLPSNRNKGGLNLNSPTTNFSTTIRTLIVDRSLSQCDLLPDIDRKYYSNLSYAKTEQKSQKINPMFCGNTNLIMHELPALLITTRDNLSAMATLSESSLLSRQSRRSRPSSVSSSKLARLSSIESGIFHKIVTLKGEKIQLLSALSEAVDAKWSAERELTVLAKEQKSKQAKAAPREQYEQAIYKNIRLRAETEELNRQIEQRKKKAVSSSRLQHSKSRARSVLEISGAANLVASRASNQEKRKSRGNETVQDEEGVIDAIFEQAKATQRLEEQIANKSRDEDRKDQQLKRLKLRLKALADVIQRQQQTCMPIVPDRFAEPDAATANSPEPQPGQNIFPITVSQVFLPTLPIPQLLAYINEEQQQKLMFYEQLKQLTQEMHDMRQENEHLKELLARQVVEESRKNKTLGEEEILGALHRHAYETDKISQSVGFSNR